MSKPVYYGNNPNEPEVKVGDLATLNSVLGGPIKVRVVKVVPERETGTLYPPIALPTVTVEVTSRKHRAYYQGELISFTPIRLYFRSRQR